MMAARLREAFVQAIGDEELDALLAWSEEDLRDPERWATTFVFVQAFARIE